MKKILVIEDDPTIRDAILSILQEEGFEAVGVEDGNQGVQVAQNNLPHLILCDVMMPGLDGYDVLATLRQNPATAAIPFIFLTARGEKADFRQGMELGADDYLTKPCSVDELLRAVNARLAKLIAVERQSQDKLDDLRRSIALSLPHEMRTPLNSILGLSEVLMQDYDSIEQHEVLEMAESIYTAAERLHNLIQNFLLYAELEIAVRDPERIKALRTSQTLYPKVLIAEVAGQIARQAGREEDLRLDLQNVPVYISELKLKKVVEEIIKNSFKFSSPATPVSVVSSIEDGAMTLGITDRGRGMTLEQIANLGAYMQFERRLYEQQGSGLGLTIAKRLVELHGGRLTIESVPQQETTVTVTFPAQVS